MIIALTGVNRDGDNTRKFEEEGTMKRLIAAMTLLTMALLAAQVHAGPSVQAQKAYFESAIALEIIDCQHKSALLGSRSPKLHLKGLSEAQKAVYLLMHREQLVDAMAASHLENKPYKVHLFLNDYFLGHRSFN